MEKWDIKPWNVLAVSEVIQPPSKEDSRRILGAQTAPERLFLSSFWSRLASREVVRWRQPFSNAKGFHVVWPG